MKLSGRQIERRTEEIFDKEVEQKYPESKGWGLISGKGFPDRLLYNKKTKEFIIFELKAGEHEFHPFQKQIMKILTEANVRKAKIVYYDVNRNTGKTRERRRADALTEKVHKKRKSSWEGVKDLGII